jgi:DNA-binding response OmpR family regulator
MRVFVQGGSDGERRLIEGALQAAGCGLAVTPEESDLTLSVNDVRRGELARGPIRLDPARSRAWSGGREVRLSRIEVALLAALIGSERPLGRRDLLAAVWGYAFDPGTNIVAVHVARLRAKLGAEAIMLEGGCYRIGRAGGAARPSTSVTPDDDVATVAR